MTTHPLTDGMNRQQQRAITAGAGPVLVLAGPGSGKTAVLTRRIAWLIREHHVPHHRIMAVTFTNKAAGEMRNRVEALLGGRLQGMQIGTFHSTCAKLLRREAALLNYRKDFVIYDRDDSEALVKRVMKLLDIDVRVHSPRKVLSCISIAKNEMILPKTFETGDCFREMVQRVYVSYQHSLQTSNAMDFDDLLLNMALLLRENVILRKHYQNLYTYVLVDEFQDTNFVQYELVKLLAAPQNNVFVVGDEDQSIYSWRGANYRNILDFRHQYSDACQILLEQNYRSTQHILNFARVIIDCNPERTPKALHTLLGLGERVRLREVYDHEVQAEYVLEQIHTLARDGLTYSDIAVMYRSNWLSRGIEQHLRRDNLPYVMLGGQPFYERREVKDMLAYLRIVSNPDDRVSFDRVINTPRRGIGDKSIQAFSAWFEELGMPLSEALERIPDFSPAAIPSRGRNNIRQFAILLSHWRNQVADWGLVKLFDNIVTKTDYFDHLKRTSKHEEEFKERRANVGEIMNMLHRAEGLEQSLDDFLIEQALYTDVIDSSESKSKISLTTLHSAKGLEFPVVFIVSVENGILPSLFPPSPCDERPGGVEEERRLFYVGITRAKRLLLLSYTEQRGPSPFLSDTPTGMLDAPAQVLDSLEYAQRNNVLTQPPSAARPVSTIVRDKREKRDASIIKDSPRFSSARNPSRSMPERYIPRESARKSLDGSPTLVSRERVKDEGNAQLPKRSDASDSRPSLIKIIVKLWQLAWRIIRFW